MVDTYTRLRKREAQARREARRQGLHLTKDRARRRQRPHAYGSGPYSLSYVTKSAATGEITRVIPVPSAMMSIDEVETYLAHGRR
jgi:hypothetical protein